LRKLRRSLFLFTAAVLFVASLRAQESDVLVTKDGPAQSAADTDVSYTVGVTNLGPDAAVTVSLSDAIPAGMTFVSGTQDSGPAFSCTAPNPGDTSGSFDCSIALLTAGSSASFTLVFHIPPGTPPGTAFINTATVSSLTDPNSENDSATVGTVTPFPPSGDVAVDKIGPAGAGPDEDVVYTITVTNAGPDNASKVALEDILPGTMTFVSLSSPPAWNCTGGSTVTCSILTFPAGATATFTLTTHIPAGTASGTTFLNTATVTSENDPNDENDSSSTLLIVSTADVAVTKSGPANVTAGDNIAYTITVTNNGPDTANDVTLADALPPNTTFVSLTQNNGIPAVCNTPAIGTNGLVSCNFAALPNGASAQFTLTIDTGNTTSASNTATVTTTSSDSNSNNDSSTVVTAVAASADLGVTKSGPANVTAGNDITYTITATNAGPSDATSVFVTDALPFATTFVSFTQNSGPTFACTTPPVGGTGSVSCTRATFAAGATATFTFVVQAVPFAQNNTSIGNTANIDSPTPDPNPANDSSSTNTNVTSIADVGGTKSGPPAVDAGGDITYTVTITNAGPSDAADATISDLVPANTTFVSATQDSGGQIFICTTPPVGGTGTISCVLPSFPAGQSASFTFVVHVLPTAPDGSSIVNTANFTTTTSDPNGANDSATTTALVTAIAEVNVVKTGPDSVTPGTDVTYVVTVTNDGPAPANSVTLTDILPANTTFVSETQTTGPTFACTTPPVGGTGTITCTIDPMPADTTASFTIVLHVSPQATGTISNTATVTTPSDPTPANNSSTTSAEAAAPGIPTLSTWALGLLALALAAIALKR
jgi:uncharacterized repeat protein (TIGR01451 family)